MLQRLFQWAWEHLHGVVLAATVFLSAFLLFRTPGPTLSIVRWSVLAFISAGQTVFRYPIHLAALDDENRQLRTRLLEKVIDETEIDELRLEVDRLRAMLGYQRNSKLELMAARVLSHDAEIVPTSLTISAGYVNGVRANQAVVAAQGLVGRIDVEPGPYISLVRVLTDPGLRVSVVIEKPDRPMGILRWDGARLRVENVPQEAAIKPGDRVVTSGLGGIFPEDLLVGTVSAVRDDPHAMFKEVFVRSGAPLERLEEVFVVRSAPAPRPDSLLHPHREIIGARRDTTAGAPQDTSAAGRTDALGR